MGTTASHPAEITAFHSAGMKTLLVMRHAKSDWSAGYGTDHERPLNERGVRNARLMGLLLAEHGHAPNLVISSTAVRARSTATLANEEGGWNAEVVLDPGLYGTGPEAAIQAAAAAPDIDRLMLVGHQPTWSILVSGLTGEWVEMKTATVAVIEFDIDHWSGLPTSRGRLTAVFHPGDYLDAEPGVTRPNVVLTGFMGTGKSAVGRVLAGKLGMEFVDTDQVIESRHGPIQRIFAERGETAFRALERQLAEELGQRKGLVIATGGRMMLDAANIEALGRHGVVFCLVASPEQIFHRVAHDETREERPLLDVDDPMQKIRELLAERQMGYARFHQIDTDDREVEDIAETIARLWRSEQREKSGPDVDGSPT